MRARLTRRAVPAALLTFSLALLIGCQGGTPDQGPKTIALGKAADLSGVVTFRGQAVPGKAFVQVVTPIGLCGIYPIDEQGRYEAKGVPVGLVRLCVTIHPTPVAATLGGPDPTGRGDPSRPGLVGMPQHRPGGPGSPGMPPGPGGPGMPPRGGPPMPPMPPGPGGPEMPPVPGGPRTGDTGLVKITPGQPTTLPDEFNDLTPEKRAVYEEILKSPCAAPETTTLLFNVKQDGPVTLNLPVG